MTPGMTLEQILDLVCYAITDRQTNFTQNKIFIKKVIDSYRSSTGKVPVILIKTTQRHVDAKPAQLTAASRVLADDLGLNVLIDCSENAFVDNQQTGREYMIQLEPMSWDQMRQLPSFKELYEMLNAQGNVEVVLTVCGGEPLKLNKLKNEVEKV